MAWHIAWSRFHQTCMSCCSLWCASHWKLTPSTRSRWWLQCNCRKINCTFSSMSVESLKYITTISTTLLVDFELVLSIVHLDGDSSWLICKLTIMLDEFETNSVCWSLHYSSIFRECCVLSKELELVWLDGHKQSLETASLKSIPLYFRWVHLWRILVTMGMIGLHSTSSMPSFDSYVVGPNSVSVPLHRPSWLPSMLPSTLWRVRLSKE